MKGSRWTAAEDAVLRRRWTEGRPVDEIAAATGRTRDAVIERRKALGLASRPRGTWRPPGESAALDAKLAKLWSEGASTSEAMAALGMSRTGVGQRRRALGLPARGKRTVSEERDDELRRLWNEGATAREIGRRLGISAGTVLSRRAQLGLPPRTKACPQTAAPPAPEPDRVGPDLAPCRLRGLPIRDVPIGPPPRTCQWIDGDPLSGDWSFCGAPSVRGARAPYCEAHLARAYRREEA